MNLILRKIRQDYFGSVWDSLITILLIFICGLILVPILDWMFYSADFAGQNREACSGQGACWVFIKVRLGQIFFGFYDAAQRWRPVLSFVIFFSYIFFCFTRKGVRQVFYFLNGFVVLSLLTWGLIWGSLPGLSIIPTDQWGGLTLTLIISLFGILASLPLGVLLALGRQSNLPMVRWFCILNIELWRGVPLITVLFMASVMFPLFLPEGMNLDKLIRCLLGVTFFASAYMAEVVRGGLQAIPKGQYQGSMALGLSYWKSMTLVILPQALRHVIPGIVNTFIGLFKDTTLVLIVGLFDLLGIIQSALSDPEWLGFSLEAYTFVAAIYFIFCFSMSRVSRNLETQRT